MYLLLHFIFIVTVTVCRESGVCQEEPGSLRENTMHTHIHTLVHNTLTILLFRIRRKLEKHPPPPPPPKHTQMKHET